MNIKAITVKFVDTENGTTQEMDLRDVGKIAEDKGLDVICVNESGGIPVVKIGDYSKMVFDKKKKEKENLKKQRSSIADVKEVRITDTIAEHDLKIKAKNVDKFLANGDKVIISIRYKGRTIQFIGNGKNQIKKLLSFVTEPFVEGKYATTGNTVSVTIAQKK